MPTIPVITTFDPARLPLVKHFCDHYRSIGVDMVRLNLQIEPGTPPEEREAHISNAERVFEEAGAYFDTVMDVAFDAQAIRRHHNLRERHLPYPARWVVWADSDEFQEHPGGIGATIEALERDGYDAKPGRFVDRVARGGALLDPTESESIWATYPLGTDLTGSVLQARSDKIVVSRRGVRIALGNHQLLRGETARLSPHVTPVHHFKWNAEAVERMRRRLEPDWQARCPWWIASASALRWIEQAGGALPFDGLSIVDFGDDRPGAGAGPASGNPAYTGGPYWSTPMETAARSLYLGPHR